MDEPAIEVGDLLGAIARQAVTDYRNGARRAGMHVEGGGSLMNAHPNTGTKYAYAVTNGRYDHCGADVPIAM